LEDWGAQVCGLLVDIIYHRTTKPQWRGIMMDGRRHATQHLAEGMASVVELRALEQGYYKGPYYGKQFLTVAKSLLNQSINMRTPSADGCDIGGFK